MTDVLTLFDPEFGTFEAEAQRPLTLKERFTILHISNPQVFKALQRMTQQMVDRGRTRSPSRRRQKFLHGTGT